MWDGTQFPIPILQIIWLWGSLYNTFHCLQGKRGTSFIDRWPVLWNYLCKSNMLTHIDSQLQYWFEKEEGWWHILTCSTCFNPLDFPSIYPFPWISCKYLFSNVLLVYISYTQEWFHYDTWPNTFQSYSPHYPLSIPFPLLPLLFQLVSRCPSQGDYCCDETP